MSEMFELLKEGLEGIIQHQKGKKKLKKRIVEVPEPATQYKERITMTSQKEIDKHLKIDAMCDFFFRSSPGPRPGPRPNRNSELR